MSISQETLNKYSALLASSAYPERFRHYMLLLLDIEGERNTDQGGDTVHGISRNAYPNETPWPPSDPRIIEIYYTDFFQEMRCGDIDDAHFAYQFFVAAANVGAPRARRMIWEVLGMPLTGQIVGPVTLKNLNAAIAADRDGIYSRFLRQLSKFYFSLTRTNPGKYAGSLEGWINRILIAIDI